MPHRSQFPINIPSGVAQPASAIAALFPCGAVAVQMEGSGDPASLLPEEAVFVQKAVLKRQQEFAAGRACARYALRELGMANFAILSAKDRQPIWPQDYIGSITHSGAFCVAVVANAQTFLALGIDSETIADVGLSLWPTICTAAELRWLYNLPTPVQQIAATLIFCAKEALYKCQFPLTSEWLDFHDLELAVDELLGPDGFSSSGSFSVRALKAIAFADRVPLPIGGRYLVHDGYLTAAITVPHTQRQ